jgi:hypothetical protein
VLLALGWALGSGWLATQFVDALGGPEFRELQQIVGVDSSEWILSVFAMARSINIATIFPLIFGGLAISSEISNKTITTTFLTAQNRTAALTAKMITYIAWGAIYGLAIVISVSIGVFLTTDADRLPGAGAWLAMAAVGVLASILMTMFGIGIGALVRSVPGTVVLLVLYFLILENGAHLLLSGQQPDLIAFERHKPAEGEIDQERRNQQKNRRQRAAHVAEHIQLVVEKRPEVKEELVVRKRDVEEQVDVEADLRRERIDVERHGRAPGQEGELRDELKDELRKRER